MPLKLRVRGAFFRSLRLLRQGQAPNRNRHFDRFEGAQGRRVLRAYKTLRSLEGELIGHPKAGDIWWKRVEGGAERLVEVTCRNPRLRCHGSTFLIEEEFSYLTDKYPWLLDMEKK